MFAIPQWGFGQAQNQDQTDFFIVPYNKSDLEPISETQKGTYLDLQFKDNRLNNLFQNYDIVDYKPAFSDLECSEYLDKIFLLSIRGQKNIAKFSNLPLIEKVEKIEPAEELNNDSETPYYPNDYIIPVSTTSQDSIPNDYLELIQAPCAWSITKGDPNINVGITERDFNTVHEDLIHKFTTIIGTPFLYSDHGAIVSGLVGADTDNELGTSSIGFNTSLVGSYGIGYNSVKELVLWSRNNNNSIKVINMSWKEGGYSTVRDSLYKCIKNKYNITLVASSGNGTLGPNCGGQDYNGYCYPASFESVISVTAVGSRNKRGYIDSEYGEYNWIDVAEREINNPQSTMTVNDKVDIAAPGFGIYAPTKTKNGDNTSVYKISQNSWGTSYSAPVVSGTIALMAAANSSLSPNEIEEILKTTAENIDTIPENIPYAGKMGAGRINAFKAVKMAQNFNEYGYDYDAIPSDLDLMVRDNEEDIGEEPNETTEIFWNSPDIWVRNEPDGIEKHENAKYDPDNPSYVYVRVKNIGCDPSSEDDQLKLYWTKAASSMSWPEDYMGGEYIQPGNALKGDTIGTVNIPSIKPGEETILEVPWSNVPNPDDYEVINDKPWHYCLLARIKSEDDPMTTEETSSIRYNDEHNNNIASKNLTVINLNPENIAQPISGGFVLPNPLEPPSYFDLELIPDDGETGSVILDEAEIKVTLDEVLTTAWEAGGNQSTQLEYKNDGIFLVTGENAIIENIKLEPGEFGVVQLQFNFLIENITEKETYLYHAIQRNKANNKIMGGESYQINKSPRPLFSATTSGNKTLDKGEKIILNAELIGEPAAYNWYDNEGNLIYEGADFSTSAKIGKQYKLEVVTLSDGYKDYAEVELTYKPNRIKSLSPNPTTGEVEVEYKINEGESAYLAVTSIENPNTSDNYILNMEESAFNLNIDNLSTGIYAVALIVNGQIVDTKNLIKN